MLIICGNKFSNVEKIKTINSFDKQSTKQRGIGKSRNQSKRNRDVWLPAENFVTLSTGTVLSGAGTHQVLETDSESLNLFFGERSVVCLNCERTFTFSDFLKRDTREKKAVRNIKRFQFLVFSSQNIRNVYDHASLYVPECESCTQQHTLRNRGSRREIKKAQMWKGSDKSVIKQNLSNDRKYSTHKREHMSNNLTIT